MNTISYAAIITALASATACFAVAADDEAAIRALEDRFAAALNAGDVAAIMRNYVPDKSLVVFDVVPPRQHLGADAYRKAWVGFFATFKGTPKIAISASSSTATSASVTASSTSWAPLNKVTQSIGQRASPTAIARSGANG